MQHILEFVKATGAGNDFVILDGRNESLPPDKAKLAASLCDRHFGIGADGLLIVEKSTRADFSMLYFNADGSHGGMCGNGGRCIAMYAYLRGFAPRLMKFEALDHIYPAEILDGRVKLRMKRPSGLRNNLEVSVGGKTYVCDFVDTGAPHVVLLQDHIDQADIKGVGRSIREHERFAPAGTNVNFMSITPPDAISIRTYERGVEDETLACGTGSVASAVVAATTLNIQSPVKVRVRSGELLYVHLRIDGGTITEVYLEGNAAMLFSGRALYDDISGKLLTTLNHSESSMMGPRN